MRSTFPPFLLIGQDINIAHTLFALPFALLGAGMAAAGDSRVHLSLETHGSVFLLVLLSMVSARTAAMIANRLLDRHIDAANPRTEHRALPSGRLSPGHAQGALAVAGGCFILCCTGFGFLHDNWWPTILSLPVLVWICSYALLKRSTALCHLYLGASLAMSPLAAALAVDPHALSQPALWWLAFMVLCWVTGFDIIYALLDQDIDRQQGLFSVPSRFGTRNSLLISRALHGIAAACLLVAWRSDDRFNALFLSGVLLVILLLSVEHATVSRWATSRRALDLFTLNGMISCLLCGLGLADLAG